MRLYSFIALAAFSLSTGCSLPPEDPETQPAQAAYTGGDAQTGDAQGAADAGQPVLGPTGIPVEFSKFLSEASYDAATGALTLQLTGFDDGDLDAVFAAVPGLDTAGYLAFTFQDDPLDRHYTALVQESADGSVWAVVVADGGQFNRYFSGSFYERDGDFNTPAVVTGQVAYAGTYAAVSNVDGPGTDLALVDPAVDDSLLPHQAGRIDGKVFLNANFTETLVNGSVFDRVLHTDSGAGVPVDLPLPSLALIVSDIDESGEFVGDVEFIGGDQTIGSYGGIFSGDAGAVAGVVSLTDIDDNLYSMDQDEELGLFVLVQCGQAGDHAICDSLD
jgi:hypothetical protein